MVKRLSNKVFFLFLLTYSLVFAGDIRDILNYYFKEEIEQSYSDNRILVLSKTYAEFNPIGGFADGRYKLINYRLERIEPNIYFLELDFQKKKGSFRFNQKVYYYFWYDGNVIAFKTYKGKYKYYVPKPSKKVIKRGNEYIIQEEPNVFNVVLPARGGKVYLYLLFR